MMTATMTRLFVRAGAFISVGVLFTSGVRGGDATALVPSASEPICCFVTQNIQRITPPILAVVPFTHEDGSKSMEGQLITERVITELSSYSGLRLVERENLNQALTEQKLGAEGFLSRESAAKTGKLTGARVLLTGTLMELGDSVELHLRLFSVESGEVAAATRVRARRSIRTFISPLWDDMDQIKAQGTKFNATLHLNKDRLRIGDEASLSFQTDRDCYVTLFDFATDGSITVLFPNKFQPNNKVTAGLPVNLPGENADYKIRVRGPAGLEHLKLFATVKDVPLYVRDYSQSPFSTVNEGDPAFVRGLKVMLDSLQKTDWAEVSTEFQIENVLR